MLCRHRESEAIGAVAAVAHPALKAVQFGLLLHPRAKADTLDTAQARGPRGPLSATFRLISRAVSQYHTGSGRWTRIEDSWVVEQRVAWCPMRRGGEPWRGLLII